jgi:hypothetical protein
MLAKRGVVISAGNLLYRFTPAVSANGLATEAASIDIFLDPTVHGRGVGRDAVATLTRGSTAPPLGDRPGGG